MLKVRENLEGCKRKKVILRINRIIALLCQWSDILKVLKLTAFNQVKNNIQKVKFCQPETERVH